MSKICLNVQFSRDDIVTPYIAFFCFFISTILTDYPHTSHTDEITVHSSVGGGRDGLKFLLLLGCFFG